MHAFGGIRTHKSQQASGLRPRGHWDRQTCFLRSVTARHPASRPAGGLRQSSCTQRELAVCCLCTAVRCYWDRCNTALLTYLLTLLTPRCRVLLEKLTGLQLVKKFTAFHGTRRFITALTSVRQLSLSWASPIQSIYPHPTSWRSVLILSTHLCLGLPSGLFPSGFPTKTLYTSLTSPIRATCPPHLILLDFITRTIMGEQYRSLSSSLCSLLHSPVTSSLKGPNILLNTMFSNTLNFLSTCNVSDQVYENKNIKLLQMFRLLWSFQVYHSGTVEDSGLLGYDARCHWEGNPRPFERR